MQANEVLQKIQNDRGESIAEVLMASLVAAFGLLALATMLTSAQHMIQNSDEHYREMLQLHNAVEAAGETETASGAQVSTKTGTLLIGGEVFGYENGQKQSEQISFDTPPIAIPVTVVEGTADEQTQMYRYAPIQPQD